MLKTNKKDLLNAIEKATKSNLDLNKFYILADNGNITLSGFHVSRYYKYQIEMFIENSGDHIECYEIELDSKFKTILKKFSGSIDISIADNKITFADSKKSIKKPCTKADGIELIKKSGKPNNYKLDSVFTHELLKHIPFVGVNDNRPVLNGINIHENMICSTDSYRGALTDLSGLNIEEKINIPVEVVKLIASMKTDIEQINVYNQNNGKNTNSSNQNDGYVVELIGSGFKITTSCIDGFFPDIKRIIPSEFKTNLLINHKDLMDNQEAANVFKQENKYITKMIATHDNITIESHDDQNQFESIIEGSIIGNDVTFAYDGKFMTDILKQIELKTNKALCVKINSPVKPFIIEDDSNTTYLLMPVRIY